MKKDISAEKLFQIGQVSKGKEEFDGDWNEANEECKLKIISLKHFNNEVCYATHSFAFVIHFKSVFTIFFFSLHYFWPIWINNLLEYTPSLMNFPHRMWKTFQFYIFFSDTHSFLYIYMHMEKFFIFCRKYLLIVFTQTGCGKIT